VKSYILSPISSENVAAETLALLLPGQRDPWLLKDSHGDAMAYFNVGASDTPRAVPAVSVDISGRHYNCDADVLAVLEKVKERVGGDITYAP
jgi:hypothetical protein